MATLTALALEHLLLRLRPLNRALQAAVEHQSQLAARLIRHDVTPLCVTDEQVKTLLDDVDALIRDGRVPGTPALLDTRRNRHARSIAPAECGVRCRAAAGSARADTETLAI